MPGESQERKGTYGNYSEHPGTTDQPDTGRTKAWEPSPMTSLTPSSSRGGNRRAALNFDRIVALLLAVVFVIVGGRSLVKSLASTGEQSHSPVSTLNPARQALIKALAYYGASLGPDSRRILTDYLKANVNVNEFISGQSLLDIATECGYSDIVADLLNRGANPNLRDLGWTPLYSACEKDNYQIAAMLIEYGAEVNESKGDDWTPLLAAASNSKNPQLIKLLLIHEANVNAIAPTGASPLDLALQRTDPEGKVIAGIIRAAGGRAYTYKIKR